MFGVGGLLTGWMDFNNDGHFDESERLTWTLDGVVRAARRTSIRERMILQITIPAGAVDRRPIAARFRWGEQGLSFTGPAAIGEVEDYFFGLNFLFGDYNRDGVVDQADYNLWRRKTFGKNVNRRDGADGNGDGVINQADFDVWRAHFGQMLPGRSSGFCGDCRRDSTAEFLVGAAAGRRFFGLTDGSTVGSTANLNGVLDVGGCSSAVTAPGSFGNCVVSFVRPLACNRVRHGCEPIAMRLDEHDRGSSIDSEYALSSPTCCCSIKLGPTWTLAVRLQ